MACRRTGVFPRGCCVDVSRTLPLYFDNLTFLPLTSFTKPPAVVRALFPSPDRPPEGSRMLPAQTSNRSSPSTFLRRNIDYCAIHRKTAVCVPALCARAGGDAPASASHARPSGTRMHTTVYSGTRHSEPERTLLNRWLKYTMTNGWIR